MQAEALAPDVIAEELHRAIEAAMDATLTDTLRREERERTELLRRLARLAEGREP